MRILVIAAHQNIEKSRINKRWLAELREYPDQITVNELYKVYPDYAINPENEQDLVARHDRIVLQFHYKFYGAVKAKDDIIENSASHYVEHISSPDLNPIIVRKRMLDEMSKASSNPL